MAKTSDDLQDVQVTNAKDQDGLTFRRHFSTDGMHPFDEVEWETRDAVIPNFKEGGNASRRADAGRKVAKDRVPTDRPLAFHTLPPLASELVRSSGRNHNM